MVGIWPKAREAEQVANRVAMLLGDRALRARIGRDIRSTTERQYTWTAAANALRSLVGGPERIEAAKKAASHLAS
jgi:hypothetical protein